MTSDEYKALSKEDRDARRDISNPLFEDDRKRGTWLIEESKRKAEANEDFVVPPGVYRITDPLWMGKGNKLEGNNEVILIADHYFPFRPLYPEPIDNSGFVVEPFLMDKSGISQWDTE